MNKILITGASGLIGRNLTARLLKNNFEINWLVRSVPSGVPPGVSLYLWKPESLDMPAEALENVKVIFNLAGAGIADKRWTDSRKLEIEHSRVGALRTLGRYLSETRIKPYHLISASAIGYYGSVTSEKIFSENDHPGNDFLAQTCAKWEREAKLLEPFVHKLSIIRIGVVLSRKGGALPSLVNPIQNYLGAPIGSGKQIVPWIHEDDLISIMESLIHETLPAGIYNGVAPEIINNEKITRQIAQIIKKPIWPFNIPLIVLHAILGEMHVLVTQGSAVSAQKLVDNGFTFNYPSVEKALQNLLL